VTAGAAFDLKGEIAVVTGASSGLGAHFARVLAGAGAKVALAARRLDRLQVLAGAIGAAAMPVELDVTDPASVVRAFDQVEAGLGAVSVLVNNAGVPSGRKFVSISESEWRSVMAVNLDGVFRVGQEAARRMIRSGKGGAIVNIASIAAFASLKTLAPYSASKAGVVSLTKTMALELAKDRIRVNALAPGYFVTELNEAFLKSQAGERLLSKVPFGRAGALHELDGPLLLLASRAGSFMTGSVVTIDGGHLLADG
jgi:NAD(P)-dependent dehydrogenase (short-subunit alcohol dehydrogenase family)